MDIAVLAALAYVLATIVVVAFQVLLALGAPWGSNAMGGRFPGRFPPAMRVLAVVVAMESTSARARWRTRRSIPTSQVGREASLYPEAIRTRPRRSEAGVVGHMTWLEPHRQGHCPRFVAARDRAARTKAKAAPMAPTMYRPKNTQVRSRSAS